jgi:hypothetical protein
MYVIDAHFDPCDVVQKIVRKTHSLIMFWLLLKDV